MDHVYAKVQRLRNEPFRRLLSDETLWDHESLGLSSRLAYNPATILDDGEWFELDSFKGRDFSISVVSEGIHSSSVDDLEKKYFDSLAYLLAVQGEDLFFQRIRPSTIIRRTVIALGDSATLETGTRRLVVNKAPDAVYIAAEDKLLFRDLAAIAGIFPGIDMLFKEATEDEVQEFLKMSFIASELDVSKVSKPNRKRIAVALKTLDAMSADDQSQVLEYTQAYVGDKLEFDGQSRSFAVRNDEDLKVLIFGIEQRFYTTPIGAEKRLANSVVKL